MKYHVPCKKATDLNLKDYDLFKLGLVIASQIYSLKANNPSSLGLVNIEMKYTLLFSCFRCEIGQAEIYKPRSFIQ